MPLKLNTLVDCSNDITQIGSIVHGLTLQVQSILLCTPVVLHVASPPFNLPIGSALHQEIGKSQVMSFNPR